MARVGDYAISAIDKRIRKLLQEELKKRTTAVSGGGYAVTPTGSGGVPVHGHNSSAHTGIGADDHHDEDHAARHAPGGDDELDIDADAVDYDNGASGLAATDAQAAIDELAETIVSVESFIWLPLTTTNSSGDPELVWDDDDSLIPTQVPA